MHLMNKSDLPHEEQDTFRKSKESCTIFYGDWVSHYDRTSYCLRQKLGHVYYNPTFGRLTCRSLRYENLPRNWVFF